VENGDAGGGATPVEEPDRRGGHAAADHLQRRPPGRRRRELTAQLVESFRVHDRYPPLILAIRWHVGNVPHLERSSRSWVLPAAGGWAERKRNAPWLTSCGTIRADAERTSSAAGGARAHVNLPRER
jgi:hypothetical protein